MPAEIATSTCQRCNGTGEYHGTRRDGSFYVGACFGCNGMRRARYAPRDPRYPHVPRMIISAPTLATNERGDLSATPAGHTSRQPRADRNWHDFATRYPAEAAWLLSPASGDFGQSLINGCRRYGGLTPRQLASVQRNVRTQPAPAVVSGGAENGAVVMTNGQGVTAIREPNGHVRPAAPIVGATPDGVPVTESDVRNGAQVTLSSMVDVIRTERMMETAPFASAADAGCNIFLIEATNVRRAMDAAAASGLRKVRLVLGAVTFKLSGRMFRNGGAGMILCYREGAYKGYIDRNDLFHKSPNAILTANDIAAFRGCASDPQAAARTHGQDTGHCACCRRLLTDPVSVMSSVGPICARRFGWGNMIRTATA